MELLGERHRSLVGRAVKEVGVGRVIEVLIAIEERPPADPVSYFAAAVKAGAKAYDESGYAS